MTLSSYSIGSLAAYANHHLQDKSKSKLEKDISILFDALKLRVKEREISEISTKDFYPKVFDLKFDIIEQLSREDFTWDDYCLKIDAEIIAKDQIGVISKLAKSVADLLDCYKTISIETIDNSELEINSEEVFKNLTSKLNYETIGLFEYLPNPRMKAIKTWIDFSLELEINLIISDLIIDEKLFITKKKITALINHLNQTFENWAAYLIFIGFWKPKLNFEDINPIFNNISILNSSIEVKNGIGTSTNIDNLMCEFGFS
jgi:hypothetical protein